MLLPKKNFHKKSCLHQKYVYIIKHVSTKKTFFFPKKKKFNQNMYSPEIKFIPDNMFSPKTRFQQKHV